MKNLYTKANYHPYEHQTRYCAICKKVVHWGEPQSNIKNKAVHADCYYQYLEVTEPPRYLVNSH